MHSMTDTGKKSPMHGLGSVPKVCGRAWEEFGLLTARGVDPADLASWANNPFRGRGLSLLRREDRFNVSLLVGPAGSFYESTRK